MLKFVLILVCALCAAHIEPEIELEAEAEAKEDSALFTFLSEVRESPPKVETSVQVSNEGQSYISGFQLGILKEDEPVYEFFYYNTDSKSNSYPTAYQYNYNSAIQSGPQFGLVEDPYYEFNQTQDDYTEDVVVTNGDVLKNSIVGDLQPELVIDTYTEDYEEPSNQTLFQIFSRAPTLAAATTSQTNPIPTVCLDGDEDRVEFEVAGGLVISSTRFPYMVSIQQRGSDGSFNHFCGGTLLTNKLIMTAAHCVYAGFQDFVFYDYRKDMSQIYGEMDLDQNIFAARAPTCRHLPGEDGRLRVVRHYLHPSYNGNTIEGGDIAILEVEKPFDYDGPFVQVWPATTNQPYDNVNVVAGWGATNEDEIYDVDLFVNSFQELRMGILRWMDQETCKNEVAQMDEYLASLIDSSVICFQNRGVDGCRADSGGPLLQLGPDFINDVPANDVQLGIVSWGPDITCTGASGLPGLYTNVSMYAAWVQTIVGLNSQPSPSCYGNLSVFSEPVGDVLLSGFENPQPTAKDCCESCSALPGCNAWVYCYYKDGCAAANNSIIPREYCELKQFEGQVQLDNTPGIMTWGGYNQEQIA